MGVSEGPIESGKQEKNYKEQEEGSSPSKILQGLLSGSYQRRLFPSLGDWEMGPYLQVLTGTSQPATVNSFGSFESSHMGTLRGLGSF